MDRVGREAIPTWPKRHRTCPQCKANKVEDVAHFISECPAYSIHRKRLHTRVFKALDTDAEVIGEADFKKLDAEAQTRILLGQRIGNRALEDSIDTHIKLYLTKAWNIRKPTTEAINRVMGTSYDVYQKIVII